MYFALGLVAQKCVWRSVIFSNAVKELVVEPQINVDNQGGIKLAKFNASRNRTKHVDINYHLIRDMLAEKNLCLMACPATNPIEDIFKKLLLRVFFKRFRTMLGLDM